MDKTIKARVQHKHDIEANWLKATNFTPLASEIIVYDPDENYDYPRIKIGDGKTNINTLPFVTKDYAKISDIPTKPEDIGALPDSTVIPTVPTKISAFENDKGYLTQHQSLDAYAKTADLGALATKDSLTASEVGALPSTTKIPGALSDLSEDTTHRVVTDAEKGAWNAKSNFSGSYNDLTNKPTIPSIAGLASTTYVDDAVKNKVDKDGNKVLSTNDYTTAEKNKLANIAAGAEVNVNADWNATSGDAQILNKPTLGSMAAKSSVAKSDLTSDVQTSLGKADSALQPGNISDWAKQSSKPSYTKGEVGLSNVDNTSDANKPVSTAQANAIADAKKAGTDAQSNLTTHSNNKSNPHGVTKAQVGLENVDNVKQYSANNPPAVIQDEAPEDVNLLWIDPNEDQPTIFVKTPEPPQLVNDISQCSNERSIYLLPNGHLAAYMTTEVVTEGTTVPNFTNLFDTSKGAEIHNGTRFSSSGGTFKEQEGSCSIVLPLGQTWKTNKQFVIRVREALVSTAPYYDYVYGRNTETATNHGGNGSASGVCTVVWTQSGNDAVLTATLNSADNANVFDTLIFNVAQDSVDVSKVIITFNEEITYTITEGKTEIVTEWKDTQIEYNQPPDYTERVLAIEKKTTQLRNDVNTLENKINNGSFTNSNEMNAFAFSAYPPSPQLPGDGTDKADFNVDNIATSEVYNYMDTLWNRYRTYMIRQNLGKDSSGQYDYYRYVFSKAYWRAWYKENYPKMFAWINDNTIIYSESVSPRIGDTMYTTPYIGTVYNTVAAVNSETIGVASTRIVDNQEFIRYVDGDVEPTIVYTVPIGITNEYLGRTYTDAFEPSSSIAEFTHDYVVNSQGIKFYRYPFKDKKLDGSSLFSVFILANEHGNKGDSMIPCVTVLRILKDLCGNTNIPFLQWLKENAIVTVIPLGNPYGGYNNVNGVNINRNYDTPGWAGSNTDPAGGSKEDGAFGVYAGDQIETQYIMNTIQQCKPRAAISCHGRGIPHDVLGEYNSSATYQGCGFDAERMFKVEEALFTMYNFGFAPNGQHLPADVGEDESYLNAGKSPSYIEYSGAVGGLIEIDDHEVGTRNSFTPLAMEQAYAEVMLVLQNWCEEALLKVSNN